MSNQNINIPKGTRDFGPEAVLKREYIFDTIKEKFRLYGYKPIETPAMENLSTLLGKYGEEGDKLLFKILNSGNYLDKIDINEDDTNALSLKICEKGLRYDLTVPFARFVVQHRNEIVFPFRRYQVQPVWRADKPQKGRYREFYQCDADVIGSDSLLNELELINLIDEVFSKFGITCVIKFNNRKVFTGIAEVFNINNKINDIIIAIDKIEKTGKEQVIYELKTKDIKQDIIDKLMPVFEIKGDYFKIINYLKDLFKHSETGLKGIDEIESLFTYIEKIKLNNKVELDLSLARGLNYYTGTIIEVKAADINIGSICGGGRYDNLTGIFGLKDISGVGISFGAERIYDVLTELDLFPKDLQTGSKIMLVNFGGNLEDYCLGLLKTIREAGINCELYPSETKIQKQMQYANQNKIKYVILAGEDEIANKIVTLKNMLSGEQHKIKAQEIVKYIE